MGWKTDTVLHMPPAPDKELPFIVINFFHFPSEAVAKEYEETVRNWWPELIFFVGPMSGDVSERYTHCIICLYKDFDEYKRNIELYAAAQDQSPEHGAWPGYKFDHVYCCRVADGRDPIVREHGIEGWTKRLHEIWASPKIANPERAREWSQDLWAKLANDWGAEALVRSGWLPATGPKPQAS